MIVKDINELKTKCDKVTSIEEGERIAVQLIDELKKSKDGVGLAANQIGINKQVCVVWVKDDPWVLINPEIYEVSKEKFYFVEKCLSFPKKKIRTERSVWIKVMAENHEGILMFSADSKDISDAVECVCVQHEIDHLHGVTMFDRKVKPFIATSNKIGRNEKMTLTKGSQTKTVKYKKMNSYIEDGWTLVEQ